MLVDAKHLALHNPLTNNIVICKAAKVGIGGELFREPIALFSLPLHGCEKK